MTGMIRQGSRHCVTSRLKQSTSTPRVVLSSSILLIRPNPTLRKSTDPELIWSMSSQAHTLTLSSEEVSRCLQENLNYICTQSYQFLSISGKKGNNLNYLRCCEWKLLNFSCFAKATAAVISIFTPCRAPISKYSSYWKYINKYCDERRSIWKFSHVYLRFCIWWKSVKDPSSGVF